MGISIDGPKDLHNAYRVDKRNNPTFDAVLRGISTLKRHAVEFNTLTVVNRRNALRPLEVYEFLKEIGSGFLQFIPLVERRRNNPARQLGLHLATPPSPQDDRASSVTSWSVEPEAWGSFLIDIFERWVRRDVGHVFVQMFDVALGNWMGIGSGLCVFNETCGRSLAIEHNGDVYSCDHYVYPEYRLGNLMNRSLGDMVNSARQRTFGTDKRDTLPRYCRECPVRFACHGECPKHRFLRTPSGEPGLNYLCAGYRRFFLHVDPHMQKMANLLRQGRPAAHIMSDFNPSR